MLMLKRFSLFHGLLVSAILHGAVTTTVVLKPWTLWGVSPSSVRRETLDLEMLGIVGEKQVEEQVADAAVLDPPLPADSADEKQAAETAVTREETPPEPIAEPEEPPPPPAQESQQEPPPPLSDATSPVEIAAPPSPTPKPPAPKPPPRPKPPPPVETVQAPQEPSQDEAAASADPPRDVVQAAEADRQQEHIDLEKQRQNQISQYGTQIYRKIARNLSFPNDAKGTRLTGKPKIRFVVSANGEIAGPVEIVVSSGHPALDQAAIRAAQASAPFPPPYKPNLPVAMSVNFSVSK